MKLSDAIKNFDIILINGPLGTRLKYDYGISNLPDLFNNRCNVNHLINIYENDIKIAKKHNKMIIVNAVTFRASKNHLVAESNGINFTVKNINEQALKIIQALRIKYDHGGSNMILGAPIGPMHNAYSVEGMPTPEEAEVYHEEQLNIFINSEIDFINAVTIPTLSEGLGIARAAEKSALDYTIGFVLNSKGTLLDGTSLHHAISKIDATTKRNPVGYFITCTHSTILSTLKVENSSFKRLIGAQLNGSDLPLSHLERSNNSDLSGFFVPKLSREISPSCC